MRHCATPLSVAEAVVAPAKPSRRRTVAVLALSMGLHALAALHTFTIPAIAPEMAAGLGANASLVGVQVLLVCLAGMFMSPYAGAIVIRLGTVRAVQLSMVLGAIGVGLAAVPSLPVVATASLILGAAYGLVGPATGQMLETAVEPNQRGLMFSIKQTAVPVGGVLAGVVAPPCALALGWQGALIAIAGTTIAGALLMEATRRWFPFRRAAHALMRASRFGDLALIWHAPALRHTCIAAGYLAGAQAVLTTYLVTMLVENVGIGLIAAGAGLSLFNSGGIVGRFVWGYAADRVGSGLLVLAGVSAAGVALLVVFPFMTSNWTITWIYVFLAALGLVGAGWNGVFISELLRLAPPGDTPRALGGGLTFGFGGSLAGLALFAMSQRLFESYGATTWVVMATAFTGLMFSLRALVIVRARR